MSIPTVTIDPKAPLKVEIRCGHQQPGSYRLTLWKDNEVAHEERGNFIDPHDDVYEFQPSDVDLNGVTDVAVTSQPWSDMRVYLGQSGGQWDWFSVADGAYTGLTDVKCGDIDGDNRPDLVTITTEYFRGDRVSWWPNTP